MVKNCAGAKHLFTRQIPGSKIVAKRLDVVYSKINAVTQVARIDVLVPAQSRLEP